MDTQNSHSSHSSDMAMRDDAINLRHYWHVILERRWLVITAFLSVLILSLIYLFKAPRVYQAVTRIQINREDENAVIRDLLSVRGGQEQDYLQTQYKNLQSRSLIESVIEKLELQKEPHYKSRLDPYRSVAADVTITPIRLSRLVDIKVQHPQCLETEPSHGAEKAAEIANMIARTFIENNLREKQDKMRATLDYLKEEAQALEKQVANADRELHKYRLDNKLISLVESENILLQSLKATQAELVQAQNEAATAQTAVNEIDKLMKGGMAMDSIPEIVNNASIQKLRNDLALARSELAQLLTRYLDRYPAVIQQREKISELEGVVKSETQNIYNSILAQARIAASKQQTLQESLSQREKDQFHLGAMRIEYEVLSRKAETSKMLYNVVLQRLKESELTQNDQTQNMRIRDSARPQLQPVKPRVMMTVMLGVVAGALIAVGLAFFVNYLDDSIKSQDDVEAYLRLPFLGYIPNIKTNSLVDLDLQAHLHPRSNAAEGFRTIRAAITLMPRVEQFRVITMTSTIPSEGKSLVSANLAIVFAQTGLKTLLVDADLRRPSMHKAFRLHSPIGLSSYLTGQTDNVDDIIHHSEVGNLDVVCCGSIPANPSELMSSKRMQDFLAIARQRYDRIFLDCPPVSAVSDPLVLAAQSDGTVFVTKFNRIRRNHARRTVQRLQDSGIFIIGVVLNDIDFEGKDSYYYSYYYYQNRYYGHYNTDPDGNGSSGKDGAEKAAADGKNRTTDKSTKNKTTA